ncbi:hypothetical protein [Lactococcus formosensis]|jgi:hypothetical protein|uniref:hypothetical protein n=1 Tax=Lactococcus formosensis TaxID=1281486 RepID=UPI00254F82F7|nr:hypothetical protein [Lactococcus formosensis]
MTKELTKEQWHDVRMTLRIIIRNKKNAKKSQLINEALQNIKDEVDRKIFQRYYIDGWGITKITMDMYYEKSVVIRRNNKATKQFAEAYDDGHLLNMFHD